MSTPIVLSNPSVHADATSPLADVPAGTWRVDRVHSSVAFAVKHSVVLTFRSRFERFDGSLEVGADGSARLVGVVEADSVVVRDDALAAHLTSPDFFDTDRHPQITFASTAVHRAGETLVVDGLLTLKGVTRPVRLTGTLSEALEDADGDLRVGAVLATTVDRTEFGLVWNQRLPKGGMMLADDVRIEADLAFVHEA